LIRYFAIASINSSIQAVDEATRREINEILKGFYAQSKLIDREQPVKIRIEFSVCPSIQPDLQLR
jgi:hypothetical protein